MCSLRRALQRVGASAMAAIIMAVAPKLGLAALSHSAVRSAVPGNNPQNLSFHRGR